MATPSAPQQSPPAAAVPGRAYALAVGGVAVGAFVLFAATRSSPIDDAYISFRYLDQWLRGNGLVFNAGERVEGYSNFLWVLLLGGLVSLASLVPGSPGAHALVPGVSVWVEVLLAAGTAALLVPAAAAITRRRDAFGVAAAALLAASSSYVFWVGKGLETVLYGFLQLLLAFLVARVRESEASLPRAGWPVGLVGGALALTRPEGAVAPAIVFAVLALRERRRRAPFLLALAVVAAAVLAHTGFRLAYYGSWLPNTYHAKHMPPGEAFVSGFLYLREFFAGISPQGAMIAPGGWAARLPALAVCACAVVVAVRRLRTAGPVVLQAAVLAALPLALGSDWMPGYRFLAPAIPLGCLIVAAGLAEVAGGRPGSRLRRQFAAALLAVVLAAGAFESVTVFGFTAPWRSMIADYRQMADALAAHAPRGSLVALSDVGTIAYYNPDVRFLDVFGLADAHIASLPGTHFNKSDVEYVLSREPDYVLAMVEVWPDGRPPRPKTLFDAQFLSHPRAHEDYVSVAVVHGWRSSEEGEHVVVFDVYQRRPRVRDSGNQREAAP